MTSTGLVTEVNELALGGDSGLLCLLPPSCKPLLSDVETDDAPGSEQGHLLHLPRRDRSRKSRTTLSLISDSIPGKESAACFCLRKLHHHCGRNLGSQSGAGGDTEARQAYGAA